MITTILKYSIGSLLYGGLITVLFLALFIFLIKGWYKDAVFKPISFAILGILALIILWNSTIICGALAMKSDISSIYDLIENRIDSLGLSPTTTVDEALSNEIFQEVVERHPILKYYANYCDFSGWSVRQLPMEMCNTLKDYLNNVILKALLWSLGFVAVGAFIVIKTMGRRTVNRYSRSGRSSRDLNHSSRTNKIPSRNDGRRIRRKN